MGKESLKEFMLKNIKELIVDLIPVESIQHIRPKGYMYILGAVSIAHDLDVWILSCRCFY